MTVDLISRIAEKARAGNMASANGSSNINYGDLIVSLPVNAIKYHPKGWMPIP